MYPSYGKKLAATYAACAALHITIEPSKFTGKFGCAHNYNQPKTSVQTCCLRMVSWALLFERLLSKRLGESGGDRRHPNYAALNDPAKLPRNSIGAQEVRGTILKISELGGCGACEGT